MKILNKGESTITHDEGVLEAGKEGDVSPSLAEKLLALYSDVLFEIKEEVKVEVEQLQKEKHMFW